MIERKQNLAGEIIYEEVVKLEASAGVGHGGVDVKQESIREEAIKRCDFNWEIHTWMKQTSVEIIK